MRKLIKVFIFVLFLFCVNGAKVYAANDGAYNEQQFIKQVYDGMLKRKQKIVINYKGKDYAKIFKNFEDEKFLDKVAEKDDPKISDDFDYMGNNLAYMKTSIKYGKNTAAVFTIEIKWRESYDELQYVNKRIKEIINDLNIKNKTAYEKSKIIHDYIVKNVEYDSTLKKETAYCALKDNKATCQGYSLLYYKMLAEAGVKSRYITGIGTSETESGAHGWNIVKLGKWWYNVDVTWDDPVYINKVSASTKKKINRDFFLKGANTFDKNHKKDKKYLTDDFKKAYPISDTNFSLKTYEKEFDEEVEKPLVWDLDEEHNESIESANKPELLNLNTYTYGVTSVFEWFKELLAGNVNLGENFNEKWNNMTTNGRFAVTGFILFMIFLITRKIKKLIKINKMKKDNTTIFYNTKFDSNNNDRKY